MYSLYESSKFNNKNVGSYITDIFTSMMNAENDDLSLIRCNYYIDNKSSKEVA